MKQFIVGNAAGSTTGRGRKRLFTCIAAALLFGTGLMAGISVPGNNAELDAANSQILSTKTQLEGLRSKLAAAEERSASLSESLDEAEGRADTADVKAEATRKLLDAREAQLNKREAALDDREQALDVSEQVSSVSERGDGDTEDTTSVADGDPTGITDFDSAYAQQVARDIVTEIKTVDHRLKDGIAVASALNLLSNDYSRLLDAGTPPVIDASEYHARLSTLESFAAEAASMYADDPMEASARYVVVRKETGVLLGQLNEAMGTDYQLP